MNIVLLLGTIRSGRHSDKVYNVIAELLKKRGIEPVLLDLKELNIPMFDDASFDHPGVKKLTESMAAMDGCIIVTPEYNHSVPGVLKCAIDFCRKKELMNKPLASVGVSDGQFGGVRAIKQLESIWIGNRGISTPIALPTPKVKEWEGATPPADWAEKAEGFVDNALKVFGIFANGKSS